jgi:uncharacterized membrane protein
MYRQYNLKDVVMSEIAFIVLARAIHVMSGVTWAGAAFVLAMVIAPTMVPKGSDIPSPWLGTVARRAGALAGISAVLTVLSGVFLFAVLHPHDNSLSGFVLKFGATAALLSLAVGLLIGRPAGLEVARLHAGRDGAAPETIQRLSQLRTRTVVSARVAAALLAVAVLAMAVFRYAAVVG